MTASTVTRREATPKMPFVEREPAPVVWATERARLIGPKAVRFSLAALFVWFGALKLFGVSPVEGLIAETVPFLEPDWLIPLLGLAEIVLGAALVVSGNLFVLAAVSAHLLGTFTVLAVAPEVAFQGGNPLVLTTEGEFVVKNLVLLAGVITLVGARLPRLGGTAAR